MQVLRDESAAVERRRRHGGRRGRRGADVVGAKRTRRRIGLGGLQILVWLMTQDTTGVAVRSSVHGRFVLAVVMIADA